MNWNGHVNRMNKKRKLVKVFDNNPQGRRLRERPKNRWWKCVQTDINICKFKKWKWRSKNKADREKSRRRRSALECSVV